MDPETPASDSALSDLNSEEVESMNMVGTRSRSNSRASTMSASSALSSAAASPRAVDMPPAKRRKTGISTYDHATPQSETTALPPRSPTGSISSDTSGSVPNSPSFANLGTTHPLFVAHTAASANPENPDAADYMQVTRCLWEDCDAPERGDMDNLVEHLNAVHIVPRQKKYYCQWQDCTRKGQPHTSAYALKAHMRSHTKEKPFYCVLPECDRNFTRSDALAKHMRTVHETEALRPSDPVPRGHSGGISNGKEHTNGGIKRIKLIMGGGTNGEKRASVIGDLPPLPTKHTLAQMGIKLEDVEMRGADESEELVDAVDMDSIPFQLPTTAEYWPTDVWEDMDEYEQGLPPNQYFRLLRRQIHWAEEDGAKLGKELTQLRSTAEDMHGNPLTRGTGEERGADENRLFDWQQTEHILDAVLRTQVEKTRETLTGEKRDDVDKNPWDTVRELYGQAKAQL